MTTSDDVLPISTSDLLSQGQRLITLLEEKSPEALDELESYVEAVAAWESGLRRMLKAEGAQQSLDKAAGERVAEQHARVIELAEEMKDQVARSLRSLRIRGRGIRAYTDPYPKRISTIRPKKG